MSFISCFHPSKTTNHHRHPPQLPSPPLSSNPNFTTYIYHTDAGTVSLTWSRSILGLSLHVHLHHHSLSFHLHIKPFFFWRKNGTRKLSYNTRIFWSFSKARFGSRPEPESGFCVVLVVDNAITLLVGDHVPKKDTKAFKGCKNNHNQVLMMKREHIGVYISQQHKVVYNTRARFGGKEREIEIKYENKLRLLFCVDGERVLVVDSLKWKFRGNERVEVEDGVNVLISWDVHDWVFEMEVNNNINNDGHAVFMFKFEENEVEDVVQGSNKEVNVWMQQNWSFGTSCELGKTVNNKMSWSSSSVSISSSARSLGGSSSVMEWSSVEENELVVPVGFSLLVYASKKVNKY